MRRFRAIIQSVKEPNDENVLWYRKGRLMYFENGAWHMLRTVSGNEIAVDYNGQTMGLQVALDKLTADMNKLSQTMGEFISAINPSKEQIETNTADIETLRTEIDSHTSQIEGLKTVFRTLGNQISLLTTENKARVTEISELQSSVLKANQRLNSIQSGLEAAREDISTLDERVTALENRN